MSERRVVISMEPKRWRGSSVLVWMFAVEAWVFVALLAVVMLVGARG